MSQEAAVRLGSTNVSLQPPAVDNNCPDLAETSGATRACAPSPSARPLLKWAGGKTQLLNDIMPKVPRKFGRYIEPFVGGGALFFALCPERSVLADSNPELISLYRAVAADVDAVIAHLRTYQNSEEVFYATRALDWRAMSPAAAAARTIFLNRTCFNGLYRVNLSGHFNVPFGRYKNPKIVDEQALRTAAALFANASIVLGDYKEVLRAEAQPGDLVFLDPPYLPVSEYADFKRYTKEQFYEEDHLELADEVERLHDLGCHVILTNSNHPIVHDRLGRYEIEIVQSKRYINCHGTKRTGEDVIVNIPPRQRFDMRLVPPPLCDQALKFPSTRFMGSKNKLLTQIWGIASQFEYEDVLDLFSGSGVVGYMFKAHGKAVLSNDYMTMSSTFAKAMIENNGVTLSEQEAISLIDGNHPSDGFVAEKFAGLYFSDEDNRLIDSLRAGISKIRNPHKRAIAMAALIRTCLKKRPRGIFTYVGNRYDDGRRDLTLSFRQQFLEAVVATNAAVFDNGRLNKSRNGDAMTVKPVRDSLVYIDPPYYSPLSDNEYVRRYHFVEGLARDWRGVEMQEHTLTKKFKSYPTPFSSRKGAADAFDALFRRFKNNVLIVSYSSNSQPTMDEMTSIMARHKRHVEVVPVDYKYSFGTHGHKVGDNKNTVKEYLFVGY